MGIKNFLKKFYPVPTRSFFRESNLLHKEISELKQQICDFKNEAILQELNEVKQRLSFIEKNVSEAIWANVFHDTTCQSEWLKEKSFWPGRAALGYQAMYVMYRILNEIKPRRILELGLGQSTKLISQYVRSNSNVTHFVVENNQQWIDFFKNSYNLEPSTKIVKLDWKIVPYKNGETRIFDGFKERFGREKFDLILVDAPLGADLKQYSRVDVLSILPDCIDGDFVILVDDTDRLGEQNTVAEIHKTLDEKGIKNLVGWYNGLKNSTIICSENLGFLTTL